MLMREIDISVEPLTAGSFYPFGRVIEPQCDPAVFDGRPNRMIDLEFSCDGRSSLYIIRYPSQEIRVGQMERHLTMTEARVALGRPAVVLVAGDLRTDSPELAAASMRAFLIGPHQGLRFHRGTWHSLDCYPISGDWVDFAFFSEYESESELAGPELDQCIRTDFIDLEKRYQIRLTVSRLPDSPSPP
jgi:ureidoglycolate lyase